VLYLVRKPAPPLDRYIESLWYCAGATASHAKERVLPSGAAGLIVNLHENSLRTYSQDDPQRTARMPAAIVTGPGTEYSIIDAYFPEIIGVQFKIGGAFPFFRPPVGELKDLDIGLGDVWGDRDAARLCDRLQEAGTGEGKLAALEDVMRERLLLIDSHPAVEYALREFTPGRSVADVTESIGLSARRFIELFERQVGLTPKVYCRLRRFQSALRRAHTAREVDWSAVAQECGYFDQAHFIHDFRAFSGITPGAYFAHRTQFQNHVAL
jgi:AraC-like DNA-binding protein